MSMLKTWWNGRDARERRVLSIGALIVVGMLLWALVWKPLDDARRALIDSNARLTGDLKAMRIAATKLRGVSADGDAERARAGRSLLALTDAGIREIGLGGGLKRIEPAGDGRVRLRLEAIAFDPLTGWLEAIATEYGVRVSEMTATRTPYAGQVDVQLVLEDP